MVETMALRTLEELKKDFENNARRCAAIAALWENVKYKTKKDGTDFAFISKSFDGCYIRNYFGTDEIHVYGRYGIEDSIYLEQNVEDFTDIDPARIISHPYRKDTFKMNGKEANEAIKARAKYWNEQANKHLQELANIENTYNAVMAKYEELRQAIIDNTEDRSHAYYMICEMLADKIKFCRL